jgi:hypothetical protein
MHHNRPSWFDMMIAMGAAMAALQEIEDGDE